MYIMNGQRHEVAFRRCWSWARTCPVGDFSVVMVLVLEAADTACCTSKAPHQYTKFWVQQEVERLADYDRFLSRPAASGRGSKILDLNISNGAPVLDAACSGVYPSRPEHEPWFGKTIGQYRLAMVAFTSHDDIIRKGAKLPSAGPVASNNGRTMSRVFLWN